MAIDWDEPGTVRVGPRHTGKTVSFTEALTDLQQIRVILERLVAIEEERREGEREMSAFINQFAEEGEPSEDEPDESLMQRFFVKVDGRFGVNALDGTQRDATPAEAAFIQSRVKDPRSNRR